MLIAQVLNLLYNIVDRTISAKSRGRARRARRAWPVLPGGYDRDRVRQSVRRGRRAAVLDRARKGKPRERAEHYAQRLFHAARERCGADGGRSRLSQAAAVSVRRERCDVSVCGVISDGLPARYAVRDDVARTESVHKLSGLCEDRHADRCRGCGGEHCARPGLYFCPAPRCARRGHRDRHFADAFGAVGAALSDRRRRS